MVGSLKSNTRVCFVALEQSFFHYFNISRKLVSNENVYIEKTYFHKGVNLSSEQNRNTLHFINGQIEPYVWTTSHENRDNEFNLRQLYKQVDQFAGSSEQPIMIIVDCIDILLYYFTISQVIDFITYCINLSSSCIALIHKENESIIDYFTHQSNNIVTINPLDTGYSKEISGQITNQRKIKGKTTKTTKWHYKLSENSVKTIPV